MFFWGPVGASKHLLETFFTEKFQVRVVKAGCAFNNM